MADLRRGEYVRARYRYRGSAERNAMARVVKASRVRSCDCCEQVIGFGELYLSVNAFTTESVCVRCIAAGRCTLGPVVEEGAHG